MVIFMINSSVIEEIKNRLVALYNPIEIYLFGSYVWGHPDEASDLDLLVVLDKYQKDNYFDTVEGYRALTDIKYVPKDILLFTKEEFEERASSISNLCNKVKFKGKKIYARS